MGFYGNITNTSRTTFQFDKIYPSRKTMDAACREDGIYNGRYVLVEYDTELSNSEYQKPWYIVKKPVVDVGEEDNGHNKIYAASPNSAQNNDSNFFDLTTLDQQLTKADLMQGTSFIYLQQGHIFTAYNEEAKLVLFDREGKIVESSEDNLIMFNNFWDPLPSSPTKEQMTLELAKTYFGNPAMLEATLNSMGVYLVYIVNGVARTATNIDWDNLINPNYPYAAGIVKPGCQYDFNLQPEMWQLMPNNEYTQENADEEVITYIDIQLSESDEDTYSKNFNEDKLYYGTSRGYDSTVWQKVFVDGIEQYVMIAELNTVVPTFGVTTDAPTLLPLNPHWGADSTNVYYELHWQPQWGFRVKAANSKLTTQVIDPATGTLLDGINNGNAGFGKVYLRLTDEVNYPSDEKVTWENHFDNDILDRENKKLTSYYDSRTESWVTNKNASVPAAIYYNKAGFDPENIHYSTDITDPEIGIEGLYNQSIAESGWNAEKDFIGFSPTGLSGNLYNRHDGYYGKYPQIDTQEFSIMLPSIGNIIAKVWDMIYGSRELNNKYNTESTKTNKRNMDIRWENGTKYLARDGLRLRNDRNGDLYNTDAMETLAGCINTAHDLFGMIIVPVNSETFEEYEDIVDPVTKEILEHPDLTNFRDDRIYFIEELGTYCYKGDGYEFEPLKQSDYEFVEVEDLGQLTNDIISDGQYFIQIQRIEVVDGNEIIKETRYESVKELPLTFAQDARMGIYQGDTYLYAVETTDQNIQWSQQTRSFYYNYTYENGLLLHVKYYIRTIKELFSEIETPVKNYPYTINGKTFNYFRESADGEIVADNEGHNRYNYYYAPEYTEEAKDNFYSITPGNPIDVSGVYQKDKYFYFKRNSNGSMSLIRDSGEKVTAGREYYEINTDSFIQSQNNLQADGFPIMYLPGRYYYKNSQGSYLLDWTIDGSDIKAYGEKEQYGNTWRYTCYRKKRSYQTISESGDIEIYIETINYEEVEDENFESKYLPNTYFILNENNSYELCKDLTYDENKTYYIEVITYTKRTNDSAYNIDDVLDREKGHELYLGDMSFYQDDTYFAIRRDNLDDPTMITEYRSLTVFDLTQQTEDIDNTFDPSLTYFLKKKDSAETGIKYYNFTEFQNNTPGVAEEVSNFYVPNIYHYKIDDHYIFAKDPNKVNGVQYYLIQAISLSDYLESQELDSIIYGESTDLYYEENGEFVKIEDFDENINYPGGTLYIKEGIYVFEDKTPNADERLSQGMEWNVDAFCVPDTITLARRGIYNTLKPLPYYALDSSTINGLILKNTRIIENNQYTRDLDVVSGALNKVKDLIARFNRIKSQELTIVDNAGRIHSAPIETWQTVDYNQNHEPVKKRWLTSIVSGDLVSPKVVLNHTYNAESDLTLTAINMNDYDDPTTSGVVEHNHIDSINIATPRIDEMGHTVAFEHQEVIFPYAFGRIYLGTGNNAPLLEAATTHDALTIQTDDLIVAQFNNSQLVLGHASPLASTAQAGNIANNDGNYTVTAHSNIALKHGGTFKVPYIEIDLMGHTSTLKQDTITLSDLITNQTSNEISLQQVPLQVLTSASFDQPTTGDNAGKDVLNVYSDVAGSLPVGKTYAFDQYYNVPNGQTITLNTETNDVIKISNRLQQLNKTNSYTAANTLGELTTVQFQRTKWLTEILEVVDIEATVALQSNFTQLQNEVDSINVAIGNNTIYTPDDPETNDNEQRRVTIQQLTSRVAQLEEVIRRLISVDENTNSLVVLSEDEIDEILDWDRITAEPTITVTFIHSVDNKTTEENEYLISDWVRRGQFAAYEGNDEVKYYVLNQDLQIYEQIILPFAVTRAFIDTYGTMNINETEGQITIIEALTTPSL